MPSHMCTKEELGLQGSDSKFMPYDEKSAFEFTTYQQKFQCIDQDEVKVYGDFNSRSARMINI